MTIPRRALLIGIDNYDNTTGLNGCVSDATSMADLICKNENGSPNYEVKLLTSSKNRITRAVLRKEIQNLFSDFRGDTLFYFAGHGTPTQIGGYLVTQDATKDEAGIPMSELLTLATQSKAREALLILDCCYSGSLGNPADLQNGDIENKALLREGVTILSASRPSQTSSEINGQGVFTELILGALSGAAADVRGRISAAAIYAYAEQSLGAWDQRPQYKSHANNLSPVRITTPRVTDEQLRKLTEFFKDKNDEYQMDPTYEYTETVAKPENVEIFDQFKIYRNAGLIETSHGDDLYYVALHSHSIRLSPLGKFYWRLVKENKI